MGLEFTPPTHVWIGRQGDWEEAPGITDVRLEEEDLPVEDTVGLQPNVKTLASWVPACPSGRHPHHPAVTCEEHEELTHAFQDFIDRLVTAAFDAAREAARHYRQALAEAMAGIDTWEPRGLLAWLPEPEQPTPIERAMEILAPHLANEPLYQPAQGWSAVHPLPSEEQPYEPDKSVPAPVRPAWQSPYGPAPRRR